MTRRLILASTSPRRRELLGALGLPFEILPSDFDEDSIPPDTESPDTWVVKLAVNKALAVASKIEGSALIIGADTTVVLDNNILGKPKNAEDAHRMLRNLSGRTHTVYTGIAILEVVDGDLKTTLTDVAATEVTFDTLTEEIIQAYVATGEPMDKAGAYGIQGKALSFIPGIKGDYFNVVGLPLNRLVGLLDKIGVSVWQDPISNLTECSEHT